MEPAELGEVSEAGLAAMGPMVDVVTLDEAGLGAAREATAAVPGAQGPAQRRGDGPAPPPDIEGFALAVLDERHHRGVAGQTEGGAGREWDSSLELAAAVGGPDGGARIVRGPPG